MGYFSSTGREGPAVTAIVVDDDRDTVAVLSDFLQLKGITVIGKGYDGLEATDLYQVLRPDVVFLDVMMEGHDGFYGMQKIREMDPDAIIILITADITDKTRERLIGMNASAVIYKPYDINEVMDVANKLVQGLRQKLIEDIAEKKALLGELNTILDRKLHSSVVPQAQSSEKENFS